MADAIGVLAEKLSEYNLFNYLVPGSVFMVAWKYVAGIIPFENNAALFLLSAYFAGMVLSRIGSLVIEPTMLGLHFIRFCGYGAFVRAEAADPKLTTLSQENNTYRSMTAVFTTLLIAKTAIVFKSKIPHWDVAAGWACLLGLLFLFAFSHRKQCRYIARRVEAINK